MDANHGLRFMALELPNKRFRDETRKGNPQTVKHVKRHCFFFFLLDGRTTVSVILNVDSPSCRIQEKKTVQKTYGTFKDWMFLFLF